MFAKKEKKVLSSSDELVESQSGVKQSSSKKGTYFPSESLK